MVMENMAVAILRGKVPKKKKVKSLYKLCIDKET